MGFNINNQTGGIINNVEGNQYIRGDQHSQKVQSGDVRRAVQELERAAASMGLEDNQLAAMSKHLETIKAEVNRSNPEPEKVVDPLKKFTEIASAAGALAGLAAPIQTLIAWLGSLGQPLARIVAGL